MKLTIVFIVLVSSLVRGANILAICTFPFYSHYILTKNIVTTLVDAGHNITFLSAINDVGITKSNNTWKHIYLDGMLKEEKDAEKDLFFLNTKGPIGHWRFLTSLASDLTEGFFNHSKVQDMITLNLHFDLVLMEQFFNDGLKILPYHFKAPLVVVNPMAANSLVNDLARNPSPSSYLPEMWLNSSDSMSFFERLYNFLITNLGTLYRHYIFFPEQERIVRKYFPESPSLHDLAYNVSLFLINSEISSSLPKPHVPSMIEIGGFHIEPIKKLPQDLQNYLDSASEGVIVFGMGSNLKTNHLPVEKRDAILKVFGKLKQRVLWKWEDDQLPNKPENVKIIKWLPQNDVLAHPNVKLFISHGGYCGLMEATYHGVPIIAIPIFGDHKMNAKNAKRFGIGLSLMYEDINKDNFERVLLEVLNNPRYAENVKKRSKIMQDRPLSVQKTIVFWVEYVLRHQGAEHLRVAGLDLPWYQYYMLDLITCILFCVLLSIYSCKKLLSFVFNCLTSKIKTKSD